jgi:hypothetical protein
VLVIQLLAIDVESHCRRPSLFVLVIASSAKVSVLWIIKSNRYYVIISLISLTNMLLPHHDRMHLQSLQLEFELPDLQSRSIRE